MNMQIIQHYIGSAVFLALLAGFPVMIIYAVVLYFRCRKIPKSTYEKKKKIEPYIDTKEEWPEDIYTDPACAGLSGNIFHNDRTNSPT
jgi:hypothetical protein